MFWNCQSNAGEFKVESPVGAMNWGIGCSGVIRNGAGFWESWGTRVTPRSLYYRQLQDRLGAVAVENVTLPEQRTGNSLWPALSAWAGIGDLSAVTGVKGEEGEVPGEYTLAQNYPNPFNGMSDIGFQISESADVRIVVYDLLGREVAVVADGSYPAGRYSAKFDASDLSSGVYLYTMDAAGEHQRFSDVKKMILTR